MAVPDFQTMMLPILQFFSDRNEHGVKEASAHVVNYFKLSDEEKDEKISRGMPRLYFKYTMGYNLFSKSIITGKYQAGCI